MATEDAAFSNRFADAWQTLQGVGPVHFAGRREELAFLEMQLRAPHSCVAVLGAPGIGKTALVRAFSDSHRSMFPGGVHTLQLSRSSSDDLPLPTATAEPSLSVLEEAEETPWQALSRVLDRIRQRSADTRVIVVARVLSGPPPDRAAVLTLGPLSREDMDDIWGSQLLELTRGDSQLLYDAAAGNPLIGELLGRLARDRGWPARQLLQYVQGFTQPGLVGPTGAPIAPASSQYVQLVTGIKVVNDDALRFLERHPDKLHQLDPREFEILVADLFSRDGWEVTLTPTSKDGGKDLYIAHKSGLASFLYIVECKRFAPDNPVGVGIVRSLYGVVQAEKLAGGIVATTSHFTRGAKDFQRDVKYQLNLADYLDVVAWIRRALAAPDRDTA